MTATEAAEKAFPCDKSHFIVTERAYAGNYSDLKSGACERCREERKAFELGWKARGEQPVSDAEARALIIGLGLEEDIGDALAFEDVRAALEAARNSEAQS